MATRKESRRTGESSGAAAKYVAEAIGTFLLVFTVGAAVASRSPFAPLAIGASLMVMIYAGGHISGGRCNPAVTLAVLVRHRTGLRDAVAYSDPALVRLGLAVKRGLLLDQVATDDDAGVTSTAQAFADLVRRAGRPH